MYVSIYKCMKVLIIGLESRRRWSLKHPRPRCATTTCAQVMGDKDEHVSASS